MAGLQPTHSTALMTASYAGDFERCRLLCETVDRFVQGASHHYLLVSGEDVALFRQLEGTHRTVIDERDILPAWMRSFPDPLSGFRRRIWLSLRTVPLRGWHVQQLRRIAIADHVGDEALVACDSDVAFLRPFDVGSMWRGNDVRLFRRDNELAANASLENQRLWAANAGHILGVTTAAQHDYIATVIAWRRDAIRAMCRRIEAQTGRHWVSAIGGRRQFSECMIYGRYVDDVAGGEGHFHASDELCKVYWTGPKPSEAQMRQFVEEMGEHQVAIGMQSFVGADLGAIRRLFAD